MTTSKEHRWEWTLPGGAQVAATLDPATGIESVFLGGRLVSSGARGAKPAGHVFAVPGTADDADKVSVSFDPRVLICILRIGREEVSPNLWPGPQRPKRASPPRGPIPLGTVAALLAVVVLGGGAAYMLVTRTPSGVAPGPLTGVHRADNGLFVAHFPTTFVARPAVVPGGASGVVLEDREHNEAIVIVGLTIGEGSDDPWALQKRIHGEALTNLPRGSGAHDETSRSDGTCLGQPGALVLGRVTSTSGSRANLWSCAFRRGPAGYLVMYSVPESDTAGGAARLQSIIGSTELTRLEDLTGKRP
jgi:hypothetical protein